MGNNDKENVLTQELETLSDIISEIKKTGYTLGRIFRLITKLYSCLNKAKELRMELDK